MKLKVVTPEEHLGGVLGDIQARRGKVGEIEGSGNLKDITATVPLASMFGYSTAMRSLSQGRANFSLEFSHFEPMTREQSEEITGFHRFQS